LIESPTLVSPDYSKEFMIFSFTSKETIDVILLQKKEEGNEKPISFFTKALRDVEVKYEILEKNTYALVKSLKAFKVYILQSSITTYVPSNSVK
jgi:hypothetical protein